MPWQRTEPMDERVSFIVSWQEDGLSMAEFGEPVGLIPIADGEWRVMYGPIELGVLDARNRLRQRRKPCGVVDNERALPTTPQANNRHQRNRFDDQQKVLPIFAGLFCYPSRGLDTYPDRRCRFQICAVRPQGGAKATRAARQSVGGIFAGDNSR